MNPVNYSFPPLPKPVKELIRFNSVITMYLSLNPPLKPILSFLKDLESPTTDNSDHVTWIVLRHPDRLSVQPKYDSIKKIFIKMHTTGMLKIIIDLCYPVAK